MIHIQDACEIPGMEWAEEGEGVITCDTPEDLEWMLENLALVNQILEDRKREQVSN